MSRRSIARRVEGLEGRVGTGGRFLKVEFYNQARDGTLIRLPNSDDGEAEKTIRVVFVDADPDGSRGPARMCSPNPRMSDNDCIGRYRS